MKNKISSCTLVRNSISNESVSTNRFRRLLYFPVLVSLVFCVLTAALPAQQPGAPVLATITFANGNSISAGSNDHQVFNPVDILPGEAPSIQLQLPSSFVNTPVGIQPLDGGLTPDELGVAQDGSATFIFQAGTQPGLYRIKLVTRDTSVLLQFSVPHPGNP